MHDIHSGFTLAQAIPAATYSADNAVATIDMQGFGAAEILLLLGAGGIVFTAANKIEFTLTHSRDGVTYVPVTDKDLLGVSGTANGIIKSLIAAQAAGVFRFGYKGSGRYLQLLAHFSGVHGTGTVIAATVLLGYPAVEPTDNQA